MRNKENQGLPDDPSQDGAWSQRSSKEKYKEAAQRLFGGKTLKDDQPSSSAHEEATGGQSEADDTVPLEDAGGLSPVWNTRVHL